MNERSWLRLGMMLIGTYILIHACSNMAGMFYAMIGEWSSGRGSSRMSPMSSMLAAELARGIAAAVVILVACMMRPGDVDSGSTRTYDPIPAGIALLGVWQVVQGFVTFSQWISRLYVAPDASSATYVIAMIDSRSWIDALIRGAAGCVLLWLSRNALSPRPSE